MAVETFEEFKDWLSQQTTGEICLVGARAALRRYPCSLHWLVTVAAEHKLVASELTFSATRAILTAAVTNKKSDNYEKLNEALARASNSVLSNVTSASNLFGGTKFDPNYSFGFALAHEVGLSAYSAAKKSAHDAALFAYAVPAGETEAASVERKNLYSAPLDVVFADCNETDLRRTPLWVAKQIPAGLEKCWNEFCSSEIASSQAWSFWIDWYQGFLDGKPLDWDLQEAIALIPDADWEQGPGHIAGVIERLQAEVLAKKLPLAEDIVQNPDTGLFDVQPRAVRNLPLLSAVLDQIADNLKDALKQDNGLRKNSRETMVLQRLEKKYRDDPQRIELDLTSVAKNLRHNIEVAGEYPDDDAHLALLEAVNQGVRAVRDAHPEIAQNRAILAAAEFAELPETEQEETEQALDVVALITENRLLDSLSEDIPVIMASRSEQAPDDRRFIGGADANYRIYSRAAKIKILLGDDSIRAKLVKKLAKLHDADHHKALKYGTTIAGVLGALAFLVNQGFTLLGAL